MTVSVRGGPKLPIDNPVELNRIQWIDQQMNAPEIAAKAISRFLVQTNATTQGVDVSFLLTNSAGISSITLLRAKVMDISQAAALQTWAAIKGQFTWSDTDQALQQFGQAYYWIRLDPKNTTGSVQTIGPQYILLNPSLLPPLAVANVSASHAAAANGAVLVTCNVSAIPQGDTVKIYVSGYEANPAFVAVAQSANAPLQFRLQATGETITIKAIAVSPGGAEAPSGPTCSLVLNGSATVPAQIQNVQVIQIATGNQVQWPSSIETGVTQYKLYRGQRNGGFGGATLLATIAASAVGEIIYLDTAGLTGDWEYYVITVSSSGNSTQSPAANPQVLFSSAQVPPNTLTNTTNNATVDSIDAGSNATVRIYGPGGSGTSYTRYTGFGTLTRPAGSVSGLSYTTVYYILYTAGSYVASTTYIPTLPDGYEWVGKVTTVASGGTGGTGGGGGAGGTGGGNRYSTL